MNDKDKSFFIKLILAIVAFVIFFVALGLMAQLMKNRSFIAFQPPDFSTRPIISNSASLVFYQIHEIKQNKIIISGNYITEGYVIKKYICPPCPKGALCKECMGNNIVISENNKSLNTYSLTDNDLIIFTDDPNKFELNKKYRFSVKVTEYKSTSEPLNDVKLVEYEAIAEGENRTLEYLKNCEWQYEDSQKENIGIALNDILNLSEEELREKRYNDYTGKENQLSVSALIYNHCVWEPGKFLGGNFKEKEVQEAVKQILDKDFKKEETSDWKTYRNEEYGFEIKYPNNYSIFQEADQKSGEIISASSDSKKIFITNDPEMFFCCEPTYLSVEILDTYITDFKKWINDKKFINSDNNYRVKTKGYINFGKEQAYQVQATCGIDSPRNIVLVNHNSKTYYIRYDSEECLSSSENILSTFKFTNQTMPTSKVFSESTIIKQLLESWVTAQNKFSSKAGESGAYNQPSKLQFIAKQQN